MIHRASDASRGLPPQARVAYGRGVDIDFEGTIIEWRGPAPFLFVRIPDDAAEAIRSISSMVTYGWGVIPVTATSGETTWTTSLFPREGGYLLPVKSAVQRSEGVGLGDRIDVHLMVAGP